MAEFRLTERQGECSHLSPDGRYLAECTEPHPSGYYHREFTGPLLIRDVLAGGREVGWVDLETVGDVEEVVWHPLHPWTMTMGQDSFHERRDGTAEIADALTNTVLSRLDFGRGEDWRVASWSADGCLVQIMGGDSRHTHWQDRVRVADVMSGEIILDLASTRAGKFAPHGPRHVAPGPLPLVRSLLAHPRSPFS